jgi:hypothetical protein
MEHNLTLMTDYIIMGSLQFSDGSYINVKEKYETPIREKNLLRFFCNEILQYKTLTKLQNRELGIAVCKNKDKEILDKIQYPYEIVYLGGGVYFDTEENEYC